ncbi:MAG: sulfite exporter TauE/SafE family protein [Phycisphaerales bacterium]|nr:sulfite exporter TauE/SafE family protein [Phycisphaerales bacterium]
MPPPLFFPLGLAVGLIGTLIGVGGGFIMVPILWALYPPPHATPDQITAVSFFTIFANSLSGTVSYARMKRIDYRSGAVFALATVPGSLLGAWLTKKVSVTLFEGLLAAVLALGATLLLVIGGKEGLKKREAKLAAEGHLAERITTKGLVIGAAISVAVGLVASVVGIGGGVIHVPALVFVLGFAVHRATATSHFVLAISSAVVTAEHIWMGSLDGFWPVALSLAAGAVVGAQIGARLSTKATPSFIVRGLAVILLLVAVRLGWGAVSR